MNFRAARDLPAYTELPVWYREPFRYETLKNILRDSWDFECTCLPCQDEIRNPKATKTKGKKMIDRLKKARRTK
jgi:hypothetical protein